MAASNRKHPYCLLVTLAALLVIFLSGCGSDDNATESAVTSINAADGINEAAPEAAGRRRERLEQVGSWFYFLSVDPEGDSFKQLAASSYDMVVMEPIFTERENSTYDTAAVVQNLHGAARPKLVIAYIDIGQAEEWRTYWQPDWGIGDPDWIVAADPDGWEGNYPVAYWNAAWQEIWLGDDGYLQQLVEAGFDGVYLDWVEAYSDEDVMAAATRDGVDPRQEMIDWVAALAASGRERDDGFIIIAQNAAELAADAEYALIIDAIAQENIWFDGGADNEPPGDCSLPRSREEVDSLSYLAGLSPECRRVYQEFPQGTLHTSSEEYLADLAAARAAGLVIFTVDYALEPDNVDWVYRESRGLGLVPFVSERDLERYIEPHA